MEYVTKLRKSICGACPILGPSGAQRLSSIIKTDGFDATSIGLGAIVFWGQLIAAANSAANDAALDGL
jgi:hypothetical protein